MANQTEEPLVVEVVGSHPDKKENQGFLAWFLNLTATNKGNKPLVVAVIGARLNKKNKPGLRTWWRVRKAAKLGQSLRRGKVPFQYVLVPAPTFSDAKSRMFLQLAITERDKDCEHTPIIPPMGEVVPLKKHLDFVRSIAAEHEADFLKM